MHNAAPRFSSLSIQKKKIIIDDPHANVPYNNGAIEILE
jgi:hypothetical protein